MTSLVIFELIILLIITLINAMIPFIMPDTLVFGVRVPPQHVHDAAIATAKHRFYSRWGILVLLQVATSVIGINEYRHAPEGLWLAYLFIVLVANYVNYFMTRRGLLVRKEEEKWYAGLTESLVADTSALNREPMPTLWWGLPALLVIFFTVIVIWRQYGSLPNTIAIHYGLYGKPNAYGHKSIWLVAQPLWQEIMFTSIILAGHIYIRRFALRLDPASPTSSKQRALLLRRMGLRIMWLLAGIINLSLLIAYLPILTNSSPAGYAQTSIVLVLIATIIPVILFALVAHKYRHERPVPSETKQVHRDDDRYWRAGAFYFNRDDSALLVPKRFGIGMTFNFGHPVAWVFLAIIILIPVTVSVLTVTTNR